MRGYVYPLQATVCFETRDPVRACEIGDEEDDPRKKKQQKSTISEADHPIPPHQSDFSLLVSMKPSRSFLRQFTGKTTGSIQVNVNIFSHAISQSSFSIDTVMNQTNGVLTGGSWGIRSEAVVRLNADVVTLDGPHALTTPTTLIVSSMISNQFVSWRPRVTS